GRAASRRDVGADRVDAREQPRGREPAVPAAAQRAALRRVDHRRLPRLERHRAAAAAVTPCAARVRARRGGDARPARAGGAARRGCARAAAATLDRRARAWDDVAMSNADSFRVKYGPYALVAGAAVGLGAEYARQLAAHGLALVLIDRDPAALAATADAIRRE